MAQKSKPRSKWDVPPTRGTYDWILRDIRDEVARITPPPPPEPPHDPPRQPRVHVAIDIVHRTPPAKSNDSLWGAAIMVWSVVIAILLLAALAGCTAAHAQPSSWQSHRDGFMTRYQGTDQNGQWTGNSYKQGFTTFSEFNGPHGETQHCRSYKIDWQTFTECDR